MLLAFACSLGMAPHVLSRLDSSSSSTGRSIVSLVVFADWYGAHGEGGDPGVGGPFPDMCIAGVAIDRAHKGNGCLQM